ncbi:AraC-type DNA-binding protein [Evansella caseinilytica]|uniref:AraC-type DNA-binding protein n=1 Tax=Evansella caseinilytica TaxID=1503961 RepID=A0A1H3I4B9_9BACI|nr:helix-turn-helix domain-containing protein [Evansella caseinilytica]SDY21894.1 AraC-type DNA-binding protein [Evansella caseinilytica]
MNDLTTITFIAKLLYDAYKIPIHFFDRDKNVVCQHHVEVINPINEAGFTHLIHDNDKLGVPLIKTTDFLENIILLHLNEENQRAGTLLIGPSISTTITNDTLSRLVHDFHIPIYKRDKLLQYYENLIKINQIELLHAAQLAHYLLFEEEISETTIVNKTVLAVNMEGIVEKHVHSRRLDASFHMDIRQEQYIWQCIKEGDKDELTRHLQKLNVDGLGSLSKKSHIRHTKNQAIISIALATRAAIDGGLYPEIALTMSDIYIQQIEDAHDIGRIHLYIYEYLFELIDRVNANKSSDQSKPVRVCKNYIFNHVYETISIDALAEIVHLNPIYLSQLFKKETGLSLGKYIQQEKLNEAKKLLIQSDISIAEISSLLQFSDQSYFASAFKKHTGLTPRQYRKNPEAADV